MDLNPVILAIPIYFLLIGLELVVQAWQKRKYYRLNDAVSNISCGISQQVTGVFFTIITLGIYQLVWEHLRLFTIPSGWLSFVILFVLYDFCYYWAHRKSHEINLFWGGHSVHHQSEDYNLSVALRQSSTQALWSMPFYLPLAILGFDTLSLALVGGLNLLYQFWIHTETIGKLGILEKFMNTPSHHRVHHGRDPKYIDRNHAGVFIVWDKWFGSFKEEEEKPTYGITTPLNSWNPVWANLAHYAHILKNMKQVRSIRDGWHLLVKKPGWRPEYLGGYLAPHQVDRSTYTKYDRKSIPAMHLYVLLQYILLLVFTTWYLFQNGNEAFPMLHKVAATVWIIAGVVTSGVLFENKKWGYLLEIFRLATLPLLIDLLQANLPFPYLGALIVISMLSAVSLLVIRRRIMNQIALQPRHR